MRDMSDSPEGKRCSRCRRTLPRAEFNKNRSAWDGLQAYCRGCSAEYSRRYQASLNVEPVLPKPRVPDGHKRCPRCHAVKPYAEWDRNSTSSDGYASYCRTCRTELSRERYFRQKYGMTEAQRDELIASQMGVCPICLSAPAAHVDHCHTTGKVRGVLCFNCNSALGKLRDDPNAMRRAIAYLEGKVWKPTLVAPGVYRLPS